MQYALLLTQHIGQLFYPPGPAPYQQDLGTEVLIEMHMSANQDILMVVVLQLGEFLAELV